MYSQILTLMGLIVLSAIFSGSETALVSLTQSKVNELFEAKKTTNTRILKKLKGDPHKLIITILVGNNIVNVAASAYATVIFADVFGDSGVGIAIGAMTFFLLVFGEITPKAFAHQHAEGVSLFMARPIYYLQTLLFPLVWFFDRIVEFTNTFFGSDKRHTVTEGEIVAMLKIGTQEGSIEKLEKEFIENVLEFNDIEVEEVMTPRVSIDGLDAETTITEAVDFAVNHTHSRIPVYEDDMDNIVGVITIKALLKYASMEDGNKKLKDLELSKPLEVPYSKKINHLFREFQRKHVHIAIVIDEYGGTAGLVTLEDLLEEIVGDIQDEFDIGHKPIEVVNDDTIIARGDTLLEDINDHFKMKLSYNEYDSVHGMIVEHLHRFPREGEVIDLPQARIHVLKLNKNLVEKVQIRRKIAGKAKK